MNKRTRIAGLVGAGALLMGMMLASTGAISADSGTVTWTGNGTTDGQLDTVQCDTNNTPYLYWVLSPANNISAAELWINGVDQGAMAPATDNGNAAYKLQTGWFDLSTLSASAAITTTGATGNGLKLKISHGCSGTAPSFEQSQADTTEAPSTAPSFEQSQGDVTQCPCDTTPGLANTSHPADGAWLLVVALGVLLASVVVLTPARAKKIRKN